LTEREATRQQLDPAGNTGVRAVTASLAAGSFAFAFVLTFVDFRDVVYPPVMSLALVALAVACLLLIVGSSPYRAPFTSRTFAVVASLAFAAVVLEAVAKSQSNGAVGDDWGATSFGILLVAVGPYRPAREIATAGVLGAIFVGFITLIEYPYFDADAPPLAFVVIAVTPLVALSASAAVFSARVVRSINRWQERAREASQALVEEIRDDMARSVQRDRVTILGRDVLPFFADLLARNDITDDDRERAREIAASIRSIMVEEVDRSWLENIVDFDTDPVGSGVATRTIIVQDPDRVAVLMDTEQRTALRAVLVAISSASPRERPEVEIILSRGLGVCHGTVAARFPPGTPVSRASFTSYFALMRAVFSELQVESELTTIGLRFSYEQH
jgi:hypothetical protein